MKNILDLTKESYRTLVIDTLGSHYENNFLGNYIKYKVSKFPDGQQSLTLTNISYSNTYYKVEIRSRLNNFLDLELILCATSALKNSGISDIDLYIPYFIGGRSDRLFENGGVNYIKDIISPIINYQNYSSVKVLDPHSDVIEACVKNLSKYDVNDYYRWVFNFLNYPLKEKNKITLVSPDAGALKKVYNVAKHFEFDNIIVANKHRDIKTGNITHTEVPITDNKDEKKTYIIIDDICDGGRTFIEIAKVILEKRSKENTKIYLVVSHGIFSAGFKELNKYFDGIFSTNSYVDIDNPEFSLRNDNHLHKLKQYKVI